MSILHDQNLSHHVSGDQLCLKEYTTEYLRPDDEYFYSELRLVLLDVEWVELSHIANNSTCTLADTVHSTDRLDVADITDDWARSSLQRLLDGRTITFAGTTKCFTSAEVSTDGTKHDIGLSMPPGATAIVYQAKYSFALEQRWVLHCWSRVRYVSDCVRRWTAAVYTHDRRVEKATLINASSDITDVRLVVEHPPGIDPGQDKTIDLKDVTKFCRWWLENKSKMNL